MAEKSGFFNAINSGGVYDRTYNANDYSDNLAVVISNGVLRSTADDLKVTASGMLVSVAIGRAWINGHYYKNDASLSFPAVTAPTGGKRWDRVVLRFNNSLNARRISLVYVQGTAAATPTKPALTRSGDIYDLCLADVYVNTNATSLTVTDTRADASLCGWVYSVSGDGSFFTSLDNTFNTWFSAVRNNLSSVTLFKRYDWRRVLPSATNTVQFSIPQYDANTCFIDVFVNGILETGGGTDYTLAGNVITFTGTLVAGTEVEVRAYKSIDGTGIQSVSGEITALQNRVDAIEAYARYTYKCVNNNDNISLSQIAQAIYSGSYVAANVTAAAAAFLEGLGGNTFLASLPEDAQITIDVVGTCGVSTPYAGSGTALSRYKYFSFGVDASSSKKIIFDFARCQRLLIWTQGNTENIIFFGTDLNIKNVKCFVRCNAAGCAVDMVAGRYNYGKINFDNCDLKITTTGVARIAQNGNFTNCDTYISSSNTHALSFVPENDSLIRVIGGTHKAYTASAASANVSAIFYIYSTATTGVISAYNINCPTVTVSAFYQKKLSVAYGGKCYINGVITTLASEGNYNDITGKLNYSKQQ